MPSADRLNAFVSFITIFEGECLFLFVLRYYVDTYPTRVQLGIYNKLKVISQHNPTIWNKLKEIGFALDDQTKEVIFNGVIDMRDQKEPGSVYESSVQTYELDVNGNINFKPLGIPVVNSEGLVIK
ncbi:MULTISPECIES: hypothetical protein [Bacillus]|uniref:hypothetical protein n=1 Tax=Bacillus TaxID=1386 RepID=UPI0015904F8F|nr:hypothetical protein [Bacillus cereus]